MANYLFFLRELSASVAWATRSLFNLFFWRKFKVKNWNPRFLMDFIFSPNDLETFLRRETKAVFGRTLNRLQIVSERFRLLVLLEHLCSWMNRNQKCSFQVQLVSWKEEFLKKEGKSPELKCLKVLGCFCRRESTCGATSQRWTNQLLITSGFSFVDLCADFLLL